jgi:hypothetical protein
LSGGPEAADHQASAKFQKKQQHYQVHPSILQLSDLEHTRLAILNSLNATNAKCGYRSSLTAKSVEARIKVFTP